MSLTKQSRHSVSSLVERFVQVRSFSEKLCEPLEIEDHCLQSMPDASPVKWHLAHTSWFFETFLLMPFLKNYKPFNEQFSVLFNSYYNGVGRQFPRPLRGLQSRPTVSEIQTYRNAIDEQMQQLLADNIGDAVIVYRTELGLNHEQQHQELLLTDLKHAWSFNPLFPSYRSPSPSAISSTVNSPSIQWLDFSRGIYEIGAEGNSFHFDNETPQHEVLVSDFQIAVRLVTNKEFLEFVETGGYQNAQQWLSDGWANIQQQPAQHPIYWHKIDNQWFEFTLQGLQPLALDKPVCHISYYEADAYARWCGARLPTEFEWEVAAKQQSISGNFVESGEYHPLSAKHSQSQQFFGDCWEWTSSSYAAYPGFSTAEGAIGEYNGKFMCNQMVLRGGSCVTTLGHIRPSYRNFFYADARWQFSGIRLARDI